MVSFVNIDSEDQAKDAVSRSLDLIEYCLKTKTKHLVIKPNLCYYWDYTTGQTTDPRFIGTLIDYIRERTSSNIDISIIESDASAMKCKYTFKMLGYEKLAQKYEVNLVNLSEDESSEETVVVGGKTHTFRVPQTIKRSDVRINVPKIKYLPLTKITCALKNVFGCNPYSQKYKYHGMLDEVIVALNKIMNFDLCILDGNLVSGIQPKRLGLVMASRDPVAFDSAASEIAGIRPRSIKYLLLANKEGLGSLSYEQRGVDLGYFRERYPQKKFANRVMQTGYHLVYALGLERRLGLE